MKNALPLLALASLPITACVNERVYVDRSQVPDLSDGAVLEQGNLNVFGATLRGDFGPRVGFNGEATAVDAFSDAEFNTSAVTVSRVETGKGTGMVIVFTNDALLEEIEPGAYEFRYDPDSFDVPLVGVNVCSGTEDGTIDYDLPADVVQVVVADTPEGRAVDVHTETAIIFPATGEPTGAVETSDSSFILGPSR